MTLPPSGPQLFAMGTINLMLGIVLLLQGGMIGLSSRVIKSFAGVREAAISTITFSSGYLFITLMGRPSGLLHPFITQIIFITGSLLIYLAICRFTDQPTSKVILFGLLPISFVLMTLSVFIATTPSIFKQISLIMGFVFFTSSARKLLTSDYQEYKLSAIVTSVILFLYAFVLLGQLIAGFFNKAVILPLPSTSEVISGIAMLITSYLWSGGFILMISQRLQGELNELAMNDALTRVRNRRAMDRLLKFEMGRVQEEVKDFSIILIDIDHFKRINDTFGHEIGDQVLRWFASTLQKNVRSEDVVARWGGEEFLILLPITSIDEAAVIAERLREIVATSNAGISDEEIHITFSAGVSSTATNRDVKNLCKVADQALYVAKRTRNLVVNQNMLSGSEAS